MAAVKLLKEVFNMKSVKIFLNNSHKPVMEWISDGGEIMIHEIANRTLVLSKFHNISDLNKIRVVIS